MTPLTDEWIKKGENDFNSALLLPRARKTPDYDGACFHAQQCAEKYLKARLQEAGIAFPRTHDLEELVDLVLPVEPLAATLRPQLNLLSKAAVEVRYPGRMATKQTAKESVATARGVRAFIRLSFGLAP
jgi:HEPN domain-containing protein